MKDLWIGRTIFIAIFALLAFRLQPFDLQPGAAAAVGALLSIAAVSFELRLREASPSRLAGAGIGALLGIACSYLTTLILEIALDVPATPFIQLSSLLLVGYAGIALGAAAGEGLKVGAPETAADPKDEADQPGSYLKILDTSVIIDGRIADVAEAGFVEGTMMIPQFVLWELQAVADSSDSSRRNRGRRGLDILQRVQKAPNLDIKIVENDYPQLKEVDLKLIELAKELGGQIVTNDFNLNKVARLQGVKILNINELANALKPVVLPGEEMQVFILKEGKEYNQGVAYLDDGTMVVVDNARKHISKTISISVTSVLQTTAGKMIFGRFDEKGAVRESGTHRASSQSTINRRATPEEHGIPGEPTPNTEDVEAGRLKTRRSGTHKVEHAGR